MRIAELTAYHVRLPLKRPIQHASHTRSDSDNLFIRCRLADGTEGWGEGVPRSYVTGETIEGCLEQLSATPLAEQLAADCQSWSAVIALCERLQLAQVRDDPRGCYGNALRSAVELSLLDAFGRRFGEPVSRVTQHFASAETVRADQQRVRYSGVITAETRRKEVVSAIKMRAYVQNTNPYYRSSYALLQRADAERKVASLHDPALKDLRIGAVARTPPIDLLARQGLLGNLKPYHLMVDTRFESPARDMVEDLAAGEIDVGVLWGPIGGYWAKQQSVPIEVMPLTDEGAAARLDFRITMGLRRNEPEWKAVLNEFIAAHQDEIQAILQEYGVPLLDNRGRPIEAAAGARQGALEGVPEPEGFRMEAYRAPVPATLAGATTVGTAELRALLQTEAPVLIDVLPAPRPPEDRAGLRLWRPKPRDNIPGSVWLPNVGYGELSAEFQAYFEDNLERLTGGDRSRRLVIYCQADCWMSWNAAKRAIRSGYDNVVWYPEGTDGWAAAGLPLEPAAPVAMPGFAATGAARAQSGS